MRLLSPRTRIHQGGGGRSQTGCTSRDLFPASSTHLATVLTFDRTNAKALIEVLPHPHFNSGHLPSLESLSYSLACHRC